MELITSTQIYWLSRLNALNSLFIMLSIVGSLATIAGTLIMFAMYPSCDDREADMMKKVVTRILAPLSVIGILGMIFVPTTREAAAIIAIPAVVNNPQVQSVGTNTLNLVETGVQYLNDILTEKTNEGKK